MQDIRVIYEKTKATLEDILSNRVAELNHFEFILDNDIVSANGDPLPEAEMADVIQHLNTDIAETKDEIALIQSQIEYLENWLRLNQ